MKPWKAGKLVDLVEIPASWHLDDAPPTMFVKAFPNSHGWITGSATRGDLEGPVRLGLPPPRLRRLPDHHPSGQRRQAACADGAGAPDRSHAGAFRRADDDLRRHGRGLPQARAVRQRHGSRRSERPVKGASKWRELGCPRSRRTWRTAPAAETNDVRSMWHPGRRPGLGRPRRQPERRRRRGRA